MKTDRTALPDDYIMPPISRMTVFPGQKITVKCHGRWQGVLCIKENGFAFLDVSGKWSGADFPEIQKGEQMNEQMKNSQPIDEMAKRDGVRDMRTGLPDPESDYRSVWVDRAIDELESTMKTYQPDADQLARIRNLAGGF